MGICYVKELRNETLLKEPEIASLNRLSNDSLPLVSTALFLFVFCFLVVSKVEASVLFYLLFTCVKFIFKTWVLTRLRESICC